MGQANWKYILIIVILTIATGVEISVYYQQTKKEISSSGFSKIEIPKKEENQVELSSEPTEKVKDCSAFKLTQDDLDIDTILDVPLPFPELPWHEISDIELEQSWIGQNALSYGNLSDDELRRTYDYVDIKIKQGWSIESFSDEQYTQIKKYYYDELQKNGWLWKTAVSGFEIRGMDAGGPSGITVGYLKAINGYLRTIIIREPSGVSKFSVFMSDIVALKNIIPQYSPRTYLGAFYAIITSEIQQKKSLAVDYGALVYSRNVFEAAVLPGSPAEKAGLQREDIILTMNKQRIDEDHPLDKLIQERCPGEEVILRVLSGKEERDVPVILGEF